MEGRCMKCREQRPIKDAEVTQTAKGGFMAKGKCAICETTVCKIMSKDNAEKAIKAGDAKKAY